MGQLLLKQLDEITKTDYYNQCDQTYRFRLLVDQLIEVAEHFVLCDQLAIQTQLPGSFLRPDNASSIDLIYL